MRRRHEKNIFMRHSIPQRRNLPTEQLPLSEEGKKDYLESTCDFKWNNQSDGLLYHRI